MFKQSNSNVVPLPIKADFQAIAAKGKAPAKDMTAALRQKRSRNKRKKMATTAAVKEVTAVPAVTVEQTEKLSDIKPVVTVRSIERHGSTRRTNWPLTGVAVGFFGLGVAINLWNAAAGNLADTAIPAAMGVLAEAAAFLIPACLIGLPAARRLLGIGLLVFVTAFAVMNSLRMASIVAADTAAARVDRQTAGVQTADAALDAARRARDDACGRGQGKTVACQIRVQEVGKLEAAKVAAVNRVADQAKPESGDFAKLVTWLSAGHVQPGASDFDMLWLLFRTCLPQIGGLLLMLAWR